MRPMDRVLRGRGDIFSLLLHAPATHDTIPFFIGISRDHFVATLAITFESHTYPFVG